MTPDIKYMPRSMEKPNSDKDINFSPFKLKVPFDSSSTGLVPVVLSCDSSINSSANVFSTLMPTNLIPMQLDNQLGVPAVNRVSSFNNMPIKPAGNPNKDTTLAPIVNPDGSLLYPDETPEDELYSYNNNSTFINNTIINEKPSNSTEKDTTKNNIKSTNLSQVPTPSEVLRHLNLTLEDDIDLERKSYDKKINKIYKHIEEDCPGIIKVLCEYNIPEPIYKLLLKKTIKLSLNHCKRE